MKLRKIKVFFSGIVNLTNAQNLNCLALAKHLDPEKFEVRALTVYSGDFGFDLGVDNRCRADYKISYPAKLWHPIQLMRGILWSDVAYLCKPEYWKWQRFLIRAFHKKSFSTIESVCAGVAFERAEAVFGSVESIREYLAWHAKTFAITKAMIAKNKAAIGLPEPNGVLYLGTDYEKFASEKKVDVLTDVILIGADLKRKGIDDYLVLAKHFPQLKFHVAGGAVGGDDYAAQCKASGFNNVIFHGPLNHDQLKVLLKDVQLHIFPSRAEGFPKVTLETAAAGVPSLVYDDYGADEWITSASTDEVKVRGEGEGLSGKSGFVVKTVEEMAGVVQALIDHPEALQPIADGARAMAKRFDWKVLVKDWEREIEGIYAS